MYERLRDLKHMDMNVRLPLPNDSRDVAVKIKAPTYDSIERTVLDEEDQEIETIDFPVLYEWASGECRKTGMPKIYMIGAYLFNYTKQKAAATGNRPESVALCVEFLNGDIFLHTIELNRSPQDILSGLYEIITDYETHLSTAMASEIDRLSPSPESDEPTLWTIPEALPAFPAEVWPTEEAPSAPLLIEFEPEKWVTSEWLVTNYHSLKEELETLKDCYAEENGPRELSQALKNATEGQDTGMAFLSICMQEITQRVKDAPSPEEGLAAMKDVAQQLEKGANLWLTVAAALKEMVPPLKAETGKPTVKVQDFVDIKNFLHACIDHGKPVTIRVYAKNMEEEQGRFVWEPKPVAGTYDTQQAQTYILGALNQSDGVYSGGMHNLVAHSSVGECVAAHSMWV